MSQTQNPNATNIQTLPNELLLNIFAHLPLSAAACLSLTNKRFYSTYYAILEKPWLETELSSPACCEKDIINCNVSPCPHANKCLINCLETWIGANYRPITCDDVFQFVNKNAYGYSPGTEQERKLKERYADYRLALAFKASVSSLLPSPYNMGADWYAVAVEIIESDLLTSESDYWVWELFLKRMFVFRDSEHLCRREICRYLVVRLLIGLYLRMGVCFCSLK